MRAFFTVKKNFQLFHFSILSQLERIIYMALSRKHFREIARILGENLADDDLINEFVSFCASQNQYFQKQVFIDAIKKHEQKMRVENVLLSEERIEQTKREIDFLK
tara:strand:+ start:301 stop:618 length:318 start_codon:yes stop_codon:yes gene_type:complete